MVDLPVDNKDLLVDNVGKLMVLVEQPIFKLVIAARDIPEIPVA